MIGGKSERVGEEPQAINMKFIVSDGLLLALCFVFVVVPVWRGRARKRFMAIIQSMAEKGRSEIDGHPVDYWLNILNQDTNWPLVVIDSVVLAFEGREWFFVDGRIPYRTARGGCLQEKGLFLIAVGPSAVGLLSEQERVFRRIAGSTELAVFSIFRWRDFLYLLKTERA